jgi:hypothetical protein
MMRFSTAERRTVRRARLNERPAKLAIVEDTIAAAKDAYAERRALSCSVFSMPRRFILT